MDERMENCKHSFNSEGYCEYCGITEEEYDESCMHDEEIGSFE